jgi:hypothetical protein
MTVLITLTVAGVDTGPFSLYSDVDGFTTPFETGVSRAALLAGYTSTLVPFGSTEIIVQSEGICISGVEMPITGLPTTTTTSTSTTSTTSTTTTIPPTTTTTTTIPPTTTTTTTVAPAILTLSYDTFGTWNASLSRTVSGNIDFTAALVNGYDSIPCSFSPIETDHITAPKHLLITAGLTTGSVTNVPMSGDVVALKIGLTTTINGSSVTHGSTFTVGSDTVQLDIPQRVCSGY